MKVVDTAVVPLPERKPTPPGGAAGEAGRSFGATLAGVAGAVLPEVKPEPPPVAAGPLPEVKPEAPESAVDGLRRAGRQVAGLSGHGMATILAQATQESGMNVNARSSTSTAAGPFQFLERTWLLLFQRYGSAYGLGDLARQVRVTNGVPSVKDPETRKRILDLRHDVDVSSGMAARYLSEGREKLSARLGRPVTETESRIAYVMGVAGATKLLRAAASGDATPAAELLPAAARANGPLFYNRADGRALSAREAVSRLARKMETDQRAMFAAIDKAAERPVVIDGSSPLGSFRSV